MKGVAIPLGRCVRRGRTKKGGEPRLRVEKKGWSNNVVVGG